MVLRAWLHTNRGRLLRWGGVFSSFAMVQLVVQLSNAAAGFLLVRSLEKPDYAWFTIAGGMSAALSVLSDSGIGNSVTTIGGVVWQDKASLHGLVIAALRLRMRMAFWASVVVAFFSLGLLTKNGASVGMALLLTMLVISPVWCISTTSVFSVVNRLHSRVIELQMADVLPALVRVALTFSLVWLGWITPLTALAAVLAAQIIQYIMVRRQVQPLLADAIPSGIKQHYSKLRMLSRRLLPNSIFLCVQGQLATWLISLLASSSEVADFGALTRLGIIFSMLGGPVTQFAAPAFARARNRRRLRGLIVAIMSVSLIFSSMVILATWWKGEWFLWLLGDKYSHLKLELLLMVVGMCVSSLGSLAWALNAARGWTRLSWLSIPLTLVAQAGAALVFPLNTVKGLACFVIASSVTQCAHAIATSLVYLSTSEVGETATLPTPDSDHEPA